MRDIHKKAIAIILVIFLCFANSGIDQHEAYAKSGITLGTVLAKM